MDAYAIKLSDDAIGKYVQRYQTMLAARQQDPESSVGNTNRLMRSSFPSMVCNLKRDTKPSTS